MVNCLDGMTMQVEQFNTWLVQKYPRLKIAALRLDSQNGEDLLHDTIVSILSRKSYEALPAVTDNPKGRMFWFYAALGNKHIDRMRHKATQQNYDEQAVLEEEEYDPTGEYTAQILFKEVWPQLEDETRRFLLATVLGGDTAKTVVYNRNTEVGFLGTLEYSNYLKKIKADLERVKL